jgi:glycerophosphoryl diester phosphodiesterase
MRTVLTAAAAAALIASLASPAVAASKAEAGAAPSSNAAGTATTDIKTKERNGSFDLQSHRGGRGEWTEESLAAFANSLKLGVTTLELDTHLAKDGKTIVWHDDTSSRTSAATPRRQPRARPTTPTSATGSPSCHSPRSRRWTAALPN